MEIFLYLFTIAPTISVPPVLPLPKRQVRDLPRKGMHQYMDMNVGHVEVAVLSEAIQRMTRRLTGKKLRKLFLSENFKS